MALGPSSFLYIYFMGRRMSKDLFGYKISAECRTLLKAGSIKIFCMQQPYGLC